MMKTTNQSPRCARALSSVLRYSTVFLLGAAILAAQGRIAKPPAQTNSNSSGKRSHVATLRSSDSPEGSRVALSSDQSLNDYEAYRRGDRFYIKIPAADVPRAEALRGRGFADVKVQRSGDYTIISFRLPPGASARVEQHSNRLEVVFTVAGGSSAIASNAGRDLPGSITGTRSSRNLNTNQRGAVINSVNKSSTAPSNKKAPASANKNAAARPSSESARNAGNSNSASKTGPGAALASNSKPKAGATPLPSPIPSPTPKPTPTPIPTPAPKSSTTALASPRTEATPVAANQTTDQSTNQSTSQPHQDRWSRMKERVNYWILLAQLNPIPVATGAVVLLLLIALFLFQRRRAKAPRRIRPAKKSTSSTTAKETTPSVQPPVASTSAPDVTPAVVEAGAVPAILAVAPSAEAAPVTEVEPTPANDRRERIAQVNDEAKKLLNGGQYDESIIGSSDPATRQLVGAELLSAIVGRSASRREQARNAFMKHGYFDDATRDLRIAESPNERAAAARRLSFVHDKEATPHLIGALDDPSPDVRRAAVEALMDLRDPAAIGPLNSLMQTENDRKVPRTLLKHAIDACATASAAEVPSMATPGQTPEALPDPSSHAAQTEREVIEL